jgi:tetratricopeptide (TPR) repeat protein
MTIFRISAYLVFLSTLITGCAGLKGPQSASDPQHSSDVPPAPESIPSKPFPASTMYSLLVAEVAGQRQQYNVALANYLDQARETQDSGIAQRATRIAQYVGAEQYALEAASIWVNNAPFDPQAHQAMAQQLMKTGDFQLALKHLESVMELAGTSQFEYLVMNAARLPDADKQLLLSQLEKLTNKYPKETQLWMAIGSLHVQLQNFDQALIALDKALELRRDHTPAALAKARVLHNQQRNEEALQLLEDLHDGEPGNKGIGVLRARILIDLKRIADARAAFQHLHQLFPDDISIQLSLGLLHFELLEYDFAIANLTPLTLTAQLKDEAFYYLGRIAEEQQDEARALRNFNQVSGGREYLPAQMKVVNILINTDSLSASRRHLDNQRALRPEYTTELVLIEAELLITEKQYNAAHDLLSSALEVEPDNIKLRYSRALLSEKLDDLELLESDLRHVLSLKPQNAEAMNALGYTLADRTNRLDEAKELIEQAIALAPDNPAIMDSLGWLHYRLGDLYKALELLEKAFASFPDHEVAAHLGEVLWKLERQDEAKEAWRKGLEQNPESEIIEGTLQRLDVQL